MARKPIVLNGCAECKMLVNKLLQRLGFRIFHHLHMSKQRNALYRFAWGRRIPLGTTAGTTPTREASSVSY